MGSKPPVAVCERIFKGDRHDLGAAAPLPTRVSSLEQGRAGGPVESSPKLVRHIGLGSIYIHQRGLVRPEFFLLEDGDIALRDNLAPVPWHVRVTSTSRNTIAQVSVLIHPRGREGLRVLEI